MPPFERCWNRKDMLAGLSDCSSTPAPAIKLNRKPLTAFFSTDTGLAYQNTVKTYTAADSNSPLLCFLLTPGKACKRK